MKDAGRVPFDFQDLFPLVGGDYSLSVLIKNEASKEFTSVEQALRIPQAGTAVQMTQPLLGYRAVRLEPAERRMKAFRVGPYQIYCQPDRVFAQEETLAVVFQLNNLADDLAAGGEVRIELLKDGQPFRDDPPQARGLRRPAQRPRGDRARRLPARPLHRPGLARERRRRDRVRRRGVRSVLRRGRPPALVLVAGPARSRRTPSIRRSSAPSSSTSAATTRRASSWKGRS